MATTYTLRQVSKSSWQITTGRTKVGYVTATPTGYNAGLGERRATAATPRAAFEAVTLPTLGYESKAALDRHNAAARQVKTARREEGRRALNALMDGNYDELFEIIGKIEKTKIEKSPLVGAKGRKPWKSAQLACRASRSRS